jgi:hypothetical protein
MPKAPLQHVATLGIDIGKTTFHLIGLDARGAIVLRQKLSRGQVEQHLANMPSCLIGMDDLPSRWWTPLLSSCGSWKVFDGEDKTGLYPRVQTRGCCTFGEQRSTSHADRNGTRDFSLHAAQLAGGCEWWSTSIQSWEQNAIAQRLSHGLSGRSGGGDRAAAA